MQNGCLSDSVFNKIRTRNYILYPNQNTIIMKKYILSLAFVFIAGTQAYSQSEPPYGMSEINAYSIFYENFRTGDYEMALQYGKWMLEAKPESIQGVNRFNLARQYERMITVYTELSKQVSDPSMTSAYLDSALYIYEDAFDTFDENSIDYYEWHFNRGRFYQENQNNISDADEKAIEEYATAYDIDSKRLIQAGDGYYVQVLLNHYVTNEERDLALQMIDEVEPHATPALTNVLDTVRNSLFTNPEERIEFLEGRLAQDPDNMELINEIAKLYGDTGNRAKSIEYAEKAYNAEPTYSNIRTLADYAKADGQTAKAMGYLEEALSITTDDDIQKRVMLEISELQQNNGNLQSARQYARRALEVDRNWGQPYIRIAGIYAAAVTQCTSDRQLERDDRTVYWLVLDYLDRARSADSSVASTVSRQYNSYQPVLPTAEDKFFRGWTVGETVSIGSDINECYSWINETTQVR